MAVGPAVLFLLFGSLTQRVGGWFAPSSLAFLAVLAAMIVARRLDPQNSYGEETTRSDLRSYSVAALTTGLVFWLIGNLIDISAES